MKLCGCDYDDGGDVGGDDDDDDDGDDGVDDGGDDDVDDGGDDDDGEGPCEAALARRAAPPALGGGPVGAETEEARRG